MHQPPAGTEDSEMDCSVGCDSREDGVSPAEIAGSLPVDAGDRARESPPPVIENCSNGVDDDGDERVDCADPVCFGKPVCREGECEDGLDNDLDGLMDCEDPDCAQSEACNPETCASYFECLVAEGCDCVPGLDCPEQGTEAFQECQQICQSTVTCRQKCISSLSVETQENIAALQGCLFSCVQSGSSWQECMSDTCLVEFASCYLAGDTPCETFFFDCIYGCGGNPHCTSECIANLSPQGYVDFVKWNQCRLEWCDKDEDQWVDSPACSNLAGIYGCLEVSGTCIPVVESSTGSTHCGQLIDCVLHCESLADAPCVAGCAVVPGIDGAQKDAISELFQCGLNACGTQAEGLTPQCLEEAWMTRCAEALAACSP